MQDVSLFFILGWETICFQISRAGILRWSGCSITQSFKIEDQRFFTFLLLLWKHRICHSCMHVKNSRI